ncbi:MAG: DUF2330 domain-containing protein [Planctomycetes bacterium]|nr:DUF2330 domain-containing protein [Planctomycetota bacterium]
MNRFIKRLPVFAAAGALSLTAAWALIPQPTAEACMHPPREFKYPIKAGAQRGLILFSDGHEELVIRPSYKVEGEGLKVKNDAVEGFTTLAWIVPVPNLPDTYKEADAKLFTELGKFTEPKEPVWRGDPRNAEDPTDDAHDEKEGAEFLEEVKVGDYTIQPVKAKGEIGAVELNGWLKDNGFGEVDAKVMKHYIENSYYWLAVKLHRDEGLPQNGEVKPLQIGFDTDKPVYPMKINQGRGSFDLELWVISADEIDTEKTKAQGLLTVKQKDPAMYQANRKTEYARLPKVVKDLADSDAKLKKLKEGDLYCYRFFGAGMDDKVDLAKLESDLGFPTKSSELMKKEMK